MELKIGKIVIYKPTEQESVRDANHAKELPAIIVRVWTGGLVNLKVVTDGPTDMWKTSVHYNEQGDTENTWRWPAIFGHDMQLPVK